MKKVFLNASLFFLAGLLAVALTGEIYASKVPRQTRKEKIKAKNEEVSKKVESATAAAPLAATKTIDAQKTMFPRFSYEEKQELHVACLRLFKVMRCFVAEKKKGNQPLFAILKNILGDAVHKIHACLAKKEIAFEDFADIVPALLIQARLSNKDCDGEQQEIRFINDCVVVCMKLILIDGIALKDHAAIDHHQDLFDTIFLGQPHLIQDPNNKSRLNELDKHGYSLLLYAVCANNTDMVKLLVEQGADIKKLHEGKRSIYSFASNDAVKKILEDAGAQEFEQALLEKRRNEVKVRLEASRQGVKNAQEGKHEKLFFWGALLFECLGQLEAFEKNNDNENVIAFSKDLFQGFLAAYCFEFKKKNIEERQALGEKADSLKSTRIPLEEGAGLLSKSLVALGRERRKYMVGEKFCDIIDFNAFVTSFCEYHRETVPVINDDFATVTSASLSERQKPIDKDAPAIMKETYASLIATHKEYSARQPQVMKLLSSGQQTNDVHGNSLVDYGLLIGNDMALQTVIHLNTIKMPNKHGVTPLAFVLMMNDADRLEAFLQRASAIMAKHEVMDLINETKVDGKHPFEYIGALSERSIADEAVLEMRRVLGEHCVRQNLRYMGLRHISKEVAIATAQEAQARFRQMRVFLMADNAPLQKEFASKKLDGDADCENVSLKKTRDAIKREEQQKAKSLSKTRNKKEAERNAYKKKEKLQEESKKAAAEAQRLEREHEIALKLKEEAEKKVQEEVLRRKETQAKKQARKQAAREAMNRAQVECERELYRKQNQENLQKERAIMKAKQEQEITRDALLARWHRLAKFSILQAHVLAAQNEMKKEREQEEQERYELMRSLSLTKEQKIKLEMLKRNQELYQRRHNQTAMKVPGDGKKTILRADAPVFTPGKK